MRNSTVAIIAYALAIGFILAVAFHSPVKFKMAAGAPAPTAASDAKQSRAVLISCATHYADDVSRLPIVLSRTVVGDSYARGCAVGLPGRGAAANSFSPFCGNAVFDNLVRSRA
jgi:hypothetical protein